MLKVLLIGSTIMFMITLVAMLISVYIFRFKDMELGEKLSKITLAILVFFGLVIAIIDFTGIFY